MDLIKMKPPEDDNIVIRNKFIIDNIFPVALYKVNDEGLYNILFLANQNIDNSSVLLSLLIQSDHPVSDVFLQYNHLNIENIKKDEERLKLYNDNIKNKEIYSTDLNMIVNKEFPKFYYCLAAKSIAPKSYNAKVLDLNITRDNFIKISIFFKRFFNIDEEADLIFSNNKIRNNIEFVNIEHIKLDASVVDTTNNMVYSHYTTGVGPTLFKFNFVSPHDNSRRLRNPMIGHQYEIFYFDDYIIQDSIYNENDDCVYIVFEERSDITNQYKSTKILKFNKEMYSKSNFKDPFNIYEKNSSIKEDNKNIII